MKSRKRASLILTVVMLLTLSAASSLYADSAGKTLEITLLLRNGTGDEPMVVLWLENDAGEFVKTLKMFSKSKAYYKDLLGWLFKSRKTEKDADVDAVSGATIRWNKSASVTVPAQIGEHDLLDGTYVLRIESRKDKGNHYRGFKIPLPKDYAGAKHGDDGYVQSVEIVIKDASK